MEEDVALCMDGVRTACANALDAAHSLEVQDLELEDYLHDRLGELAKDGDLPGGVPVKERITRREL